MGATVANYAAAAGDRAKLGDVRCAQLARPARTAVRTARLGLCALAAPAIPCGGDVLRPEEPMPVNRRSYVALLSTCMHCMLACLAPFL